MAKSNKWAAKEADHSPEVCAKSMTAVKDALYVLNGKWKLPIILALSTRAMRFKELQRSVAGITSKILSKELKEMELNDFVVREVFPTIPVTVQYKLTPYSGTLQPVTEALRQWGMNHRKRIFANSRKTKKQVV